MWLGMKLHQDKAYVPSRKFVIPTTTAAYDHENLDLLSGGGEVIS
jgi:hypothetical protein